MSLLAYLFFVVWLVCAIVRGWWRTMLDRRRRSKQPVQMEFGLWCGYANETCGPWVDDGAFYKRCARCGVRYEPICDR